MYGLSAIGTRNLQDSTCISTAFPIRRKLCDWGTVPPTTFQLDFLWKRKTFLGETTICRMFTGDYAKIGCDAFALAKSHEMSITFINQENPTVSKQHDAENRPRSAENKIGIPNQLDWLPSDDIIYPIAPTNLLCTTTFEPNRTHLTIEVDLSHKETRTHIQQIQRSKIIHWKDANYTDVQ